MERSPDHVEFTFLFTVSLAMECERSCLPDLLREKWSGHFGHVLVARANTFTSLTSFAHRPQANVFRCFVPPI